MKNPTTFAALSSLIIAIALFLTPYEVAGIPLFLLSIMLFIDVFEEATLKDNTEQRMRDHMETLIYKMMTTKGVYLSPTDKHMLYNVPYTTKDDISTLDPKEWFKGIVWDVKYRDLYRKYDALSKLFPELARGIIKHQVQKDTSILDSVLHQMKNVVFTRYSLPFIPMFLCFDGDDFDTDISDLDRVGYSRYTDDGVSVVHTSIRDILAHNGVDIHANLERIEAMENKGKEMLLNRVKLPAIRTYIDYQIEELIKEAEENNDV